MLLGEQRHDLSTAELPQNRKHAILNRRLPRKERDETRHEINEKRRKGKGGKSRVRWEARRRGKKRESGENKWKGREGIEGGKRRGEQVEREKTWKKVERKERRER